MKNRQLAEYKAWGSMKRRCCNPEYELYHRYGGRGISVCSRWLDSFSNFLSDMGPRPKGMTLDRIDNDGNYEPGNCRWATRSRQARNRCLTRFVEILGMKMALSDACDITGVKLGTASRRILVEGWSDLEAVTLPRYGNRGKSPDQRDEISRAIAQHLLMDFKIEKLP